jgi:hypothetical protein
MAAMLDSVLPPDMGEAGPAKDTLIAGKNAVVAMNYGGGMFHPAYVAKGYVDLALSQALDNAMHGEWGLAGKNLVRSVADPLMALRRSFGMGGQGRGFELKQQYADPTAHPGLEDQVRAMSASNPGSLAGKSVLAGGKSHWRCNPRGRRRVPLPYLSNLRRQEWIRSANGGGGTRHGGGDGPAARILAEGGSAAAGGSPIAGDERDGVDGPQEHPAKPAGDDD